MITMPRIGPMSRRLAATTATALAGAPAPRTRATVAPAIRRSSPATIQREMGKPISEKELWPQLRAESHGMKAPTTASSIPAMTRGSSPTLIRDALCFTTTEVSPKQPEGAIRVCDG